MQISAENVWLMLSSAMVLFMTPGLGLFYGGMTRAKAALNMIMMSFISAGIVGVVWVLWGYSMTTGDGILGLFGNPFANFGLQNLMGSPDLLKAGFSATFAIITVALISGAIADRAKFSAWALFVPVWVTLVYCPLAYMIWGGGLMSAGGALTAVFGQVIDFAGGAVVEVSSGTAAFVLALIVGKRQGFAKDPNHRPHNVPFIMIGAAILWFGWFGFNGGAATTAEQAGLIWVNTLVTPAAAMLSWLVTEKIRHGHPTSLGAASGVVAGLVAITPSCANISPLAALCLGLVAGAACAVFVDQKYRFGFDDSLDVVGVHFGAGVIGTLSLGFIALPVDGLGGGLLYGGGIQQLVAQTVAVLVTIALSGLGTLVIGRAIHRTIGFRVSEEAETVGVDLSEHAETAYAFGELSRSRFNPFHHHTPAPAEVRDGAGRQEVDAQREKEDSFA
ncbi:ammonium transporter [Arthrobacter oryzae]|uniref:ammonium transporter n=1 Tax=Arthrobacter oryzae TaxID=409290 RepID=UPI0028649CBF|nr:ammonium transporter [Arthrobacter oryzae]MDR6507972.1 Amt family ammonium transporter [Arthrobacter oryzae]